MPATPQGPDCEPSCLLLLFLLKRVESRRALSHASVSPLPTHARGQRSLINAARDPTAEEHASTASPMEQVAVASTSTSPTTAQQSPAPAAAAKTESKQADVLMLDSSSDDDPNDDAGTREHREADSSSEDEADDEAKDANYESKAKGKVVRKKRAAPCQCSPDPSRRIGSETPDPGLPEQHQHPHPQPRPQRSQSRTRPEPSERSPPSQSSSHDRRGPKRLRSS